MEVLFWSGILLVVCVSAWRVFHAGRRTGDRWQAGFGAGLLCSQIGMIVHGLTDAVTWGTRPAVVVWAIWGLAMAAHRVYVPLEHGDR